MRRTILARVASVLTAIFWWVVFVIVYAPALWAGDRNPSAAPASDEATIATNLAVIVAAVLVYAALSLLWSRLTRQVRGR